MVFLDAPFAERVTAPIKGDGAVTVRVRACPGRRQRPACQRSTAMSNNFDPNIPGAGPNDPAIIEGVFTDVQVAEQPVLGKANLVINGGKSFDIKVTWHIKGILTPLWLTALSVKTKNWVVSAYANPRGPGDGINLGTVNVPIGSNFTGDVEFKSTITVPANTLLEEDPGSKSSGVYQLTVTVFLDSDLGPVGFDMMGVADFPLVKVENPL
jgi:hypothetical protein